MKTSELISKLVRIQELRGDVPVILKLGFNIYNVEMLDDTLTMNIRQYLKQKFPASVIYARPGSGKDSVLAEMGYGSVEAVIAANKKIKTSAGDVWDAMPTRLLMERRKHRELLTIEERVLDNRYGPAWREPGTKAEYDMRYDVECELCKEQGQTEPIYTPPAAPSVENKEANAAALSKAVADFRASYKLLNVEHDD